MPTKNLITEEGRECSKCKGFFLWEEFRDNPKGINGKTSDCTVCSNKGSKIRKRQQKNKVLNIPAIQPTIIVSDYWFGIGQEELVGQRPIQGVKFEKNKVGYINF